MNITFDITGKYDETKKKWVATSAKIADTTVTVEYDLEAMIANLPQTEEDYKNRESISVKKILVGNAKKDNFRDKDHINLGLSKLYHFDKKKMRQIFAVSHDFNVQDSDLKDQNIQNSRTGAFTRLWNKLTYESSNATAFFFKLLMILSVPLTLGTVLLTNLSQKYDKYKVLEDDMAFDIFLEYNLKEQFRFLDINLCRIILDSMPEFEKLKKENTEQYQGRYGNFTYAQQIRFISSLISNEKYDDEIKSIIKPCSHPATLLEYKVTFLKWLCTSTAAVKTFGQNPNNMDKCIPELLKHFNEENKNFIKQLTEYEKNRDTTKPIKQYRDKLREGKKGQGQSNSIDSV